MDDADHDHHLAAEALRRDAHAMRNALATVRSVVQLTDDEEVRDALSAAASQLQVSIERAVAAAGIDLSVAADRGPIDLRTLLDLAVRRAAREAGRPVVAPPEWEIDPTDVLVVAPRLERLLADLLHLADGLGAVDRAEDSVTITVRSAPDAVHALERYLVALTHASGCALEVEGPDVQVRIPRSVA